MLRISIAKNLGYATNRNEKNEYQSLMNSFAHFKGIDGQCTQETIHNKLVLLIIAQIHCYDYRRDHYSHAINGKGCDEIHRRTFTHAYEGHDIFSVLTHCIIVLSIQRCNV